MTKNSRRLSPSRLVSRVLVLAWLLLGAASQAQAQQLTRTFEAKIEGVFWIRVEGNFHRQCTYRPTSPTPMRLILDFPTQMATIRVEPVTTTCANYSSIDLPLFEHTFPFNRRGGSPNLQGNGSKDNWVYSVWAECAIAANGFSLTPPCTILLSRINDPIPCGTSQVIGPEGAQSVTDCWWYIDMGSPIDPDLSLTSIDAFQVVRNAILLKGKETAFEVRVRSTTPNFIPDPLPIKVETLGRTLTGEIPRSRFVQSGPFYEATHVVTDASPVVPQATGVFQVVATLDPGAMPDTNASNNTATLSFDALAPRSLNIVYLPVNGPVLPSATCSFFCSRQPTAASMKATTSEANTLITKIFPVTNSTFTSTIGGAITSGPAAGIDIATADPINLWLWGKRTNWDADKVVGIVPKGYFDYHGTVVPTYRGIAGLTHLFAKTAVIEEGLGSTAAHELGHAYGLYSFFEGEEYDNVPPDGRKVSGFDVTTGSHFQDRFCFMGVYEPGANTWIEREEYLHLFSKMVPSVDPELLLVTAIANVDGSVELGRWHSLPAGTASPEESGQYVVRVLDKTGNVLDMRSTTLQFAEYTEPFGIVPTNRVPLLLAVPYPSGTATVEILADGKVLATVTPSAKLLRDAVTALPDTVFVGDPAVARAAMMREIANFENSVNADYEAGASASLTALSALLGQLKDSAPSTPLEFSRAVALSLVQTTAARIGVDVKIPGDVNADGSIDCADLGMVRASFGKRSGQLGFDARADTNADRIVNIMDLSFVSRQLPVGLLCR